jgi:plasmid stability protein
MASITIRNLDDSVKQRLRRQAAEHGRSLEAEARDILTRSSAGTLQSKKAKTGLDLVQPLLDFSRKYGGVELEIPARTPMTELPSFAEDPRPYRRKK